MTLNDPPVRVPGMVNVMLDLKGRLHFLHAVPARAPGRDTPAPAPDWTALLREAGFDASRFTATTPTWVPPVFGDARAAWTGTYPDRPDIPIRVEAAAWRGQPVYFQIFEPWSATTLAAPGGRPRITVAAVLAFTLFCAVVTGAFLLARRNLRLNRGDEVGAFRLALALCLMHVVAGLMTAHLTYDVFPTLLTLGLLIGRGLLLGMVVYAIYMALEPDVRRRWPETLIAWSRVLTGRWTDPLVGRDVLLGILVGVVHRLLDAAVAAHSRVAGSGATRLHPVPGVRWQPAAHAFGDPGQQRRGGPDRDDAVADLLSAVPRACGAACSRWALLGDC